MAEGIIVATTTDAPSIAENVAAGDEEAGRATAEESFKGYTQSADGRTLSYENPNGSERSMLLERLAALKDEDVEPPTDPELSEPEADEEHSPEAADVDLAAVRQAATAKAIADGEAWAAQQRAQQPAPPAIEQELNQRLALAKTGFDQKLAEIQRRSPERFAKAQENIAKLTAAGVDIAPDVAQAIVGAQAAEAFFALSENPQELQAFLQLPRDIQKLRIGQLQAQQERSRRPVSSAPAPISPVRGSATKSSLPPDEMSYADFCKWRSAQKSFRR